MVEKHIKNIIKPYKELMGTEYLPYKNHVHRVAILTLEIKREIKKEDELKIAIAAVHHDIGIWTEKTFDYLKPSIKAANKFSRN